MCDTYINIRVYYWHFKLYRSFRPAVERNEYWYGHYLYKGNRPSVPLVEVYKFFN